MTDPIEAVRTALAQPLLSAGKCREVVRAVLNGAVIYSRIREALWAYADIEEGLSGERRMERGDEIAEEATRLIIEQHGLSTRSPLRPPSPSHDVPSSEPR